jgi:hypothetical protein
MKQAMRIATRCSLFLALFLFTPIAEFPRRISAESGQLFKIDFRSHPVLTRAWSAVQSGNFSDPRLAELPELADAVMVRAGNNWALIRLGEGQAVRLQERGVRLMTPRNRPDVARHRLAQKRAESLPSPSQLQSLAAAVSADRMMAHLKILAPDAGTRYYSSAGMQTATQYAYDRFLEYRLDNVYYDTFTYKGLTIRNVVGVKLGSILPSRIYMICGHLDSTSPGRPTWAPGAEDNASGSAGVLEAARLLAGIRTDATVYFVCFTAEEQGLIGSYHLASIASQQGWDLRGVLDMDMIGYDVAGKPDLWIEGFHANSGSVALMDLLEASAKSYTDLGVYRYEGEGEGSDHEPFNSYGFPAILAIDYNWDNYPCLHQTCDVVANIIPSQLRRMVAAVLVTAAQAAGLTVNLGSIRGLADKSDSSDDSGVIIELLGTGYSPAISASSGEFAITDLLPSTYTLRASAPGYSSIAANVSVTEGQTLDVRIVLGSGAICGDFNNDLLVTQEDFKLLQGKMVGNNSLIPQMADMRLDGVLDSNDLLVMALYLAGRIPSLPVSPNP